MTVYFVLGAVVAFLLGVWLGLPGKHGTGRRRTRTGAHDPRHLAELEGALARSAESKSVKRHFTLVDGLLSAAQRASVRRRGGRAPFQTAFGAVEAARRERDRAPSSAPKPVDADQECADERA